MRKYCLLTIFILSVGVVDAQLTTQLWHPYAEWSYTNPSYSGNPFDLQAQATFSDGRSPNLFYDGDDTWKLRYMCTETGTFTFTTSSSDSDLNGLSGSVICEDNPDAMGLLVADGNNNNKFYVKGWERAIVPAWVMMPSALSSEDYMDTWIQNNIIRSGFIGAHAGGPNNCWYDLSCDGTRSDCDSEDPDPETFRLFEELIDKLYENNAFMHIWMFGDCERDRCDKYHDDAARQERLRNYLADRWGAIPNWMMGEGYDNWEDDSVEYANKWFNDINNRIAWPHLLGMRSLKNAYIDICTECNYHSYENIADPDDWAYSRFCDSYDHGTDRPVFEEDRFRHMDYSVYYKSNIEDINEQRHWLWWTAMSGGVGAIWGYLVDSDGHFSNVNGYPYDWHALIKGWHDFWYATETDGVHRFMSSMERCNHLTNGYGLCSDEDDFVFYRENTDSITFDLGSLQEVVPAVAIDTKTGQFVDLGNKDSGFDRFDAPHVSDWAVAIGLFASGSTSCGDGSCDADETCVEDSCCDGVDYNPQSQVCCDDNIFIGECCTDSDCSGGEECQNHACTTIVQDCEDQDFYCCNHTCLQPMEGSGCSGVCCASVEDCVIAWCGVSDIQASSGDSYEVDCSLQPGKLVFTDRDYLFSDLPGSLLGLTYIKTANDDKLIQDDNFLSFDVDKDVTLYIVHDDRINNPSWLGSFLDTGQDIVRTDIHVIYLSVFEKNFTKGSVTLGGNEGISQSSMYSVIIRPIETFHPADTNEDGCIDNNELFAFIDLWEQDIVNVGELMEAVAIWKDCS